jgi:formyl-CoA transferase
MHEAQQGALSGITVLDLTRVLAGPFCTMMFADMGADVIKIEQPGIGDDSRHFVPFKNGESSYYMNLNRNKRGVTLDLKKGKALFQDMVKKADIVLENYRPGTMEKLGLGYEDLKKLNPRIIYACISGFGHYGPYSQRPGYDIIGQAMGGLMRITGWPGGPPTRSGAAMSDVLGGMSCAIATLAALQYREKTGQGQKVDVALVDSVVASLENITQIYLTEGRIPKPVGNRYEPVYPYDTFKAGDGDFVIAAGNDKLFASLCAVMGQAELAAREEFKTNHQRVKHHALLKSVIELWSKRHPVDYLVDTLLEAGVPACPINTVDKLVDDPHIAGAREMFVEVDHPKAGKLKVTGSHLKFSESKTSIRTPSPLLGQHSEEVYSELLGLNAEQVAQYRRDGVI